MDGQQRDLTGPTRMSALYQYHNAPEVAPAHGLEYDDNIYPVSDKYPVIMQSPYYGSKHSSTGRYAYATDNDNRPPRIIFGMKIRTFLLVALGMVLVVVGAAVGGAVGGKSLRENQLPMPAVYTSGSSSYGPSDSPSSPSSTSTFSAATPTYIPLSDCPNSNNTTYTSSFTQGSAGSAPDSAGLKFTKHCDLQNPLSEPGAQRIAEAYVYSFSDCVELCAGYNFWNNGDNCTIAVYQVEASRPGNCWVGHGGDTPTSALNITQGTDVAILQQ